MGLRHPTSPDLLMLLRISLFQEKRMSVSSINRRPGLSGEMRLQLRKATAFKCSLFCWNGLIWPQKDASPQHIGQGEEDVSSPLV
jgi:hypothetical protein